MKPIARNREEVLNTVTHGLGALASAAALVLLVRRAAQSGDAWEVVGTAVFGATLILLYLASTIYHAVQRQPLKARLKIVDHSAIYLLIAGTYTPFMIGDLRGPWGWSLFGIVWGLAAAGVTFKLFFTGRFHLISTVVYIAMGWLAVVAIGPMIRLLSPAALGWLIAGGLAYTLGTPFYHARRLRYGHAVWHLFVLTGSACHAVAVGVQI